MPSTKSQRDASAPWTRLPPLPYVRVCPTPPRHTPRRTAGAQSTGGRVRGERGGRKLFAGARTVSLPAKVQKGAAVGAGTGEIWTLLLFIATNRMNKNNRDGTFTDVTEKAGVTAVGWASAVCVGDYNNDGFEDLFCTYFGQTRTHVILCPTSKLDHQWVAVELNRADRSPQLHFEISAQWR